MPIGAETTPNGVEFRVWAPERKSVGVVFQHGPAVKLDREDRGYWRGTSKAATAGDLYKIQLDGDGPFPDPASRFQPEGPHGWSQIVDPASFRWTDESWKGCKLAGQILYELHLGTFSEEGTWRGAEAHLEYLRDTGITVVEIMPIADFPGRFGWGYDGVQLYAPAAKYGTPDDMRRFVDRAHSLEIGVILDVVYNHMGPDGNYLPQFSADYFSKKHTTDWGEAINYESAPVREFFRENAAYWIREFHLDGLRFDATQDIHDDSPRNILAEITGAARAAAGNRNLIMIGENEPQDTKLIRQYGFDALWNDDLHHSATVAMTGHADAYYTDYRGTAQEFVSAVKYGYLYQGQWYRWQKQRRGTPNFGTDRAAMITFIQNHDQVANSAHGLRCPQLTSVGRLKAMTALILLGPGTPMLFQGQEFRSSSKFLFFADHKPELAELVKKGRAEFLAQWRSHQKPEMQTCFADPADEKTFGACKLDFSEVEKHAALYKLHCDLIRLRREDPVISQQGAHGIDGAVLSESAFVIRYFTPDWSDDRLLIVNLGRDLHFDPAPEPLLAPPLQKEWRKLWSSEDPEYNGCGTADLDSSENWLIPAESAVVLQPL